MDAASAQDAARLAASVYRALIGERAGDKYKAHDLATAPGSGVDRSVLRTLLIKTTSGDYAAGKEEQGRLDHRVHPLVASLRPGTELQSFAASMTAPEAAGGQA